jgi:integrase
MSVPQKEVKMGRKNRKNLSGLRFRNGIWHIEKTVFGKRIFESTGTNVKAEAERYLAHRIEQIRLTRVYGVRMKRTFMQAAEKYLAENQHKRTIQKDVEQIAKLKLHIGKIELNKVTLFTLKPYIEMRQKQGVKNRTINITLQVVRRILNLAASEWTDESGLTWLLSAPKIKLLPQSDARKAYPLSWEEQDRLFALLPLYLRRMALFKVNTGLRDQEVCRLQWNWEYFIPELSTSVFVIPGEYTKNGLERLVVLNEIAQQVIAAVRNQHSVYVFTSLGGKTRVQQMNNRAWRKTRRALGLPVRIHDLKHTFGRRLRAAQVILEDRQDLLGHKSTRITTHYSAAEVRDLIAAANKVCRRQESAPTLTLINSQAVLK